MTPIQQLMLGVGASKKTYLDDVFSTYVYTGTGSAKTITNGIDLSGQGGLVWTKNRTNAWNNNLIDTVRGKTKRLKSDHNGAEYAYNDLITAFNSNGYAIGADSSTNEVNQSTAKFSSWTFRKAPGFFDIVTWTGNETARTINHNLKSIPGMIMVKCTSSARPWTVWHRDTSDPTTKYLVLNETDAEAATGSAGTQNDMWNSSAPNANSFPIGVSWDVNRNNETYVAYVFAGGESTAATATSVEFDGSNDDLTIPSSTDFDFGSGDFTIECWIKPDGPGTAQGVINRSNGGASSNSSWIVYIDSSNFDFYWVDSGAPNTWSGPISGTSTLQKDQWSHIAVAREGTKLRLFVNGILEATSTVSFTIPTSTRDVQIGSQNGNSFYNGHISNVRIVKGTAVYTSSFKPPTEPLSNITNTKLLCCQGSSATSATVIPSGSITNDGSTHTTDSPFNDPAGFVFGDSGDQNVIKCGSYVGNGNNDGVAVELGWEPQYILVKCTDLAENWYIMDSMRGIISGGSGEPNLIPNSNGGESTISQIDLTPTGFKCKNSDDKINGDGHKYIYIAIRRPDGYVGKPVEAGTDVFAMDTGNGTAGIPDYDSTFPVDFAFKKAISATDSWYTGARLMQGRKLFLDTTASDSSASYQKFDSNAGWNADADSSGYQSWMFKRHAGFDVVTYTGNGTAGHVINHSLSQSPQMTWIKRRDGTGNWSVWHHGLNNGSSNLNYEVLLNDDIAERNWGNITAMGSTSFTLGGGSATNGNNDEMIAMLFASVDGISKVGYYDGSESEQTITTGFQPRFVIIKRVNAAENWYVLDTTRGWASGVDQALELNTTTAQDNSYDFGAPTSTGFTLTGNNLRFNNGGDKFIYYAHA